MKNTRPPLRDVNSKRILKIKPTPTTTGGTTTTRRSSRIRSQQNKSNNVDKIMGQIPEDKAVKEEELVHDSSTFKIDSSQTTTGGMTEQDFNIIEKNLSLSKKFTPEQVQQAIQCTKESLALAMLTSKPRNDYTIKNKPRASTIINNNNNNNKQKLGSRYHIFQNRNSKKREDEDSSEKNEFMDKTVEEDKEDRVENVGNENEQELLLENEDDDKCATHHELENEFGEIETVEIIDEPLERGKLVLLEDDNNNDDDVDNDDEEEEKEEELEEDDHDVQEEEEIDEDQESEMDEDEKDIDDDDDDDESFETESCCKIREIHRNSNDSSRDFMKTCLKDNKNAHKLLKKLTEKGTASNNWAHKVTNKMMLSLEQEMSNLETLKAQLANFREERLQQQQQQQQQQED